MLRDVSGCSTSEASGNSFLSLFYKRSQYSFILREGLTWVLGMLDYFASQYIQSDPIRAKPEKHPY